MWLARLFGARAGHDARQDDDEQPSAVPPALPEAADPTTRSTHAARKAPVKWRAHDGHRKGFDPYNSGAYQRPVWERVSRD